MKLHANARTCPKSRRLIVARVESGWSLTEAAAAAGVSGRTAAKWLARWRGEGEAGLLDRSSAPRRVPRRTPAGRVEAIVVLRRLRMTAAEIAELLSMALSTVSAVLRRVGLGKAESARSARAREPLRARAARRAAARRHQEAGPHPQPWPSRRRPPPQPAQGRAEAPRRGRLGVRPRLRRRRHSARLRRGRGRRAWRERGRLLAPRGGLVSEHRHRTRTGAERQRRLLPLESPCQRLPRARPAPQFHPPLPAQDKRKSRALHQNARRPLGLRRHLRDLDRTHKRPTRLAHPLQLHPTTRRPRPQTTRSSPQRAEQRG
jgi:transposase